MFLGFICVCIHAGGIIQHIMPGIGVGRILRNGLLQPIQMEAYASVKGVHIASSYPTYRISSESSATAFMLMTPCTIHNDAYQLCSGNRPWRRFGSFGSVCSMATKSGAFE